MELSANKIFRTVPANPANYGLGNYATYGELRVEQIPGSGAYLKTLSAKLTPDAADNSIFELQDGLADFFPFTDFNPYAVNGFALITDNQVNAQFYQAEAYGNPQVIQALTLVETFKTIQGGLPKQLTQSFFGDILPVSKQFLTWHPLRKTVAQNQPEILHFIVYDEAITSLKLTVKVYFTDGTNQTITYATQTGVTIDQVYRLPAGYTLMNLSTVNGAKTVQKYDISLLNQADVLISEVRTYVMDYLAGVESRYWLFTNSLGMFEIFRAEGKTAETMDLSREGSTSYLPNGYARVSGEMRSRVLGSREAIEVSSGFLESKEEALWAKEILLSDQVYLLTTDSRIPYLITTKSYQPYQDKNFKYFLRFSAELAYNNTKHARV